MLGVRQDETTIEQDLMVDISNSVKSKMDQFVMEAIGFLSKNFLGGSIEDYGMGRIVVGFGPGRSEDVLFRNIVFLDRVPMIEVDLIKKDKKLLVRKRLINHEG